MCVDAVGGSTPQKLTTSLDTCVCAGRGGRLLPRTDVAAVLYTLDGPINVIHVQKQCNQRSCRASCAYSYRRENGTKVNTIDLANLCDGTLFVNSKKAFAAK